MQGKDSQHLLFTGREGYAIPSKFPKIESYLQLRHANITAIIFARMYLTTMLGGRGRIL